MRLPFSRSIRKALGGRLPASVDRRYAHLDEPTLVPIVSMAQGAAQPQLPPRITIVLPALLHGRATGGPNTAYNIGARLSGSGLRVRFVSLGNLVDENLVKLRAHVAHLGELADGAAAIDFASWSEAAPLVVEPDESFMATSWQSAYTAQAALQHTAAREFFYLIQDYEPAFSAWSSNFALAAATYTMPHRAIFNDPALRDYQHGQIPESRAAAPRHIAFQPAVDRALFAPPAEPRSRPYLLLFYARPGTQRNAFEIGLHALRAAVARGALRAGEWEIRSFGAPLPSFDLGAGQTLVNDPWRDLASYAAQMRRTSIAFSLSISPATSYPVREIAATGGFAVTNTFANKNLASLRAISPRIYAAPATVDDMAAQLVRAATAVEAGEADTPLPPTASQMPPTWSAALSEVVPWIVAGVRESRDE